MKEREPQDLPDLGKGYETRDANANMLFIIGVGLIIFIFLVMAVSMIILGYFERDPPTSGGLPPPATAERNVVPPEPRLQSDPPADYARWFRRQDSLLASYGWIDERLGVARIPIDTAMAIVAASQIPFRAQPAVRENNRSTTGRSQQ